MNIRIRCLLHGSILMLLMFCISSLCLGDASQTSKSSSTISKSKQNMSRILWIGCENTPSSQVLANSLGLDANTRIRTTVANLSENTTRNYYNNRHEKVFQSKKKSLTDYLADYQWDYIIIAAEFDLDKPERQDKHFDRLLAYLQKRSPTSIIMRTSSCSPEVVRQKIDASMSKAEVAKALGGKQKAEDAEKKQDLMALLFVCCFEGNPDE